MKKKTIVFGSVAFLAVSAIALLLFVRHGQTKIQPYYSGDAINYSGHVVIATTNTGSLELFVLDGQNLRAVLKTKNYDNTANQAEDYNDVKLFIEDGRLYAYAISRYTVFKYDFSNLSSLALIKKETNNYWEWYHSIENVGGQIGLTSDKGVKILNHNLEVVNAYDFKPGETYSLSGDNIRDQIMGFDNGRIQTYDLTTRRVVTDIPLNFYSTGNRHRAYMDSLRGEIYAIDDYYAKKFSADGRLLASFRHLEAPGFEMESRLDNPYVYFSNGYGIVKLAKDNFKVLDYAYTTSVGGPQGWAMGLKLVAADSGDMLVVFNAANILVLDKNLNKVAAVRAEVLEDSQVQENLYLNIDHTSGTAKSNVKLSGGGFFPNEVIKTYVGNQEVAVVQADRYGRFNTNIMIPDLTPRHLDIKAVGLSSGLHYSISFEIR